MGGIFFLTALFLFICGFLSSRLLHPLNPPLLSRPALQVTILISSRLLTSSGPRSLSYSLLFSLSLQIGTSKEISRPSINPLRSPAT